MYTMLLMGPSDLDTVADPGSEENGARGFGGLPLRFFW